MKMSDALPFVSFVVSLIALGNSILSFRMSRRASTSDYQATQKVKLETTALIAALRAMMVKGAIYSQQDVEQRKKKDYSRYVDLTAEKKVVQDFLCSPTAIAYYSYLTERSKRAAAAYKARGGQLGAARPGARTLNPEARERGARNAGKIARATADQAYREVIPTIKSLRDSGLTLKEIAENLSANGLRTRRGRPWNAMQVSRVLRRDPAGADGSAD